MPRYQVHIEETHTVSDSVVPAGRKPGDTFEVRSFFGMTGRSERYVAKHAFDGWIQRAHISPPRLIGITLAPPIVS